jgi:nicotinamidase-related amidase
MGSLRCWMLVGLSMGCAGPEPLPETRASPLMVHTRSWDAEHKEVVLGTESWDPQETAIIVCDMWDDHWCKGAARRVNELAGPMNAMLEEARSQGVFIIHGPSSVVDFYAGTTQRERALRAPFSPAPVQLAMAERWGTKWCWPDPEREPDLPIDDTDMGCDCPMKCEIREAWTRQNAALRIDELDAITDDGQETFSLLEERGVDHVILVGVHLNMCVLGRPFGIRQMVRAGKDVVLMRDMTDTMYDQDQRPWVNHFTGTDLVVEHIERYWCPSMVSTDITGDAPFRFAEDTRASVGGE